MREGAVSPQPVSPGLSVLQQPARRQVQPPHFHPQVKWYHVQLLRSYLVLALMEGKRLALRLQTGVCTYLGARFLVLIVRPTESFNHGSAQSITIITRESAYSVFWMSLLMVYAEFICDQLRTSCNANQTAQNLCTQASAAAANASPPNSGAQADAFNAVFALQTVRIAGAYA